MMGQPQALWEDCVVTVSTTSPATTATPATTTTPATITAAVTTTPP